MSTRSDIIVQRVDGKYARVYCHFDGYISGVGATLQEHYNSQERAQELVKPGDISGCYERCDKPAGHSFDKPVEGCTVYYGRDRGEKGVKAKIFASLQTAWPEEDSWVEFVYVWQNGSWFVGDPDEGSQTLVSLSEAIELDAKGINPIKSLVKTPFGVIGKRS